jgi:hypothetical protein
MECARHQPLIGHLETPITINRPDNGYLSPTFAPILAESYVANGSSFPPEVEPGGCGFKFTIARLHIWWPSRCTGQQGASGPTPAPASELIYWGDTEPSVEVYQIPTILSTPAVALFHQP